MQIFAFGLGVIFILIGLSQDGLDAVMAYFIGLMCFHEGQMMGLRKRIKTLEDLVAPRAGAGPSLLDVSADHKSADIDHVDVAGNIRH